jgi:cytochrome c oxidase assembly factor 3
MDDGKYMPKVNLQTENHRLSIIEKKYIQKIQQQNLYRVERWNKIRRKNRYLGIGLTLGVISIYSYTIWGIKQEKFLDDFNEPEKIFN